MTRDDMERTLDAVNKVRYQAEKFFDYLKAEWGDDAPLEPGDVVFAREMLAVFNGESSELPEQRLWRAVASQAVADMLNLHQMDDVQRALRWWALDPSFADVMSMAGFEHPRRQRLMQTIYDLLHLAAAHRQWIKLRAVGKHGGRYHKHQRSMGIALIPTTELMAEHAQKLLGWGEAAGLFAGCTRRAPEMVLAEVARIATEMIADLDTEVLA